MKIAVLGSGGWGTALAMLLLENGHDCDPVVLPRRRSPGGCGETRENPMLPGVTLPESLYLHLATCPACRAAAWWCMATPSFAVRATAAGCRRLLDPETILVSVSKGIEKGTSLRMSRGHLRRRPGTAAPWWPSPAPPTPRRWAAGCPPAWSSACPDQAAARARCRTCL